MKLQARRPAPASAPGHVQGSDASPPYRKRQQRTTIPIPSGNSMADGGRREPETGMAWRCRSSAMTTRPYAKRPTMPAISDRHPLPSGAAEKLDAPRQGVDWSLAGPTRMKSFLIGIPPNPVVELLGLLIISGLSFARLWLRLSHRSHNREQLRHTANEPCQSRSKERRDPPREMAAMMRSASAALPQASRSHQRVTRVSPRSLNWLHGKKRGPE